jgi:hypothetical protein
MKVEANILRKWKSLREQGDIIAIHKESGINTTTISEAYNTGIMTMATFEAINGFYTRRAQKIKEETSKLPK